MGRNFLWEAVKNSFIFELYDKSLVAYGYRQIKKEKERRKIIQSLNGIFDINNYVVEQDSGSKSMFEQLYLGESEKASYKDIKVRIIFSTMMTWNAIKSLYNAFNNDRCVDVKIVLIDLPDEELDAKIRLLEMNDAKYVVGNGDYKDYNIVIDQPDILVVTNPFGDWVLENVAGNCKMVAVASFTLIDYSKGLNESYWDYQLKNLKEFSPDVFYYDALLYDDIVSKVQDNRICKAGNIKYDDIFDVKMGNYNADRWPKLKGKKVILYATTHGAIDNKLSEMVSFDVYWKHILAYLRKNEGVALIFRPHPAMISELLKLKFWNRCDYIRFRRFIQDSSNIVYDDSPFYNDAFGVCDAVMTDAYCGICASALPLGKPIALLYRDERLRPVHEVLEEALYPVRNVEQLIEFIKNVKEKMDPKRQIRMLVSKKLVMNFDGNNGNRLKKHILEKYHRKMNGILV